MFLLQWGLFGYECRDLLLILKSLKAYILELASGILTQYVYGWEQMSCWSIHVKRFAVVKSCLAFSSPCLLVEFLSVFMVQAATLLQKNLDNAKASLEVLVADLQFLRDQVTITQVVFVWMWEVTLSVWNSIFICTSCIHWHKRCFYVQGIACI